MARLELLSIVAVCFVFYLTYIDGSVLPCEICRGEECNQEPAGCLYGVTRDMCRRNVCKKGPGQKCGGPSDILGVCGEGMLCRCEVCTGCSLDTLKCHIDRYLLTQVIDNSPECL